MMPDAARLDVPELMEEGLAVPARLNELLLETRLLPNDSALQEVTSLLFRLNRSPLTLLERQRALQSFSDEYRQLNQALKEGQAPSALFVRFCNELAHGFKRLLLQMLSGRPPSRPHLAWCLYMAQYFLAQTMLRHYQLYQEPSPSHWRDSNTLYWLGEVHDCLDEPVSAALQPLPADTLRGLYQQVLLVALGNPFHLACSQTQVLFTALARFASLARLLPWDEEDDAPGLLVDLAGSQPCLPLEQQRTGSPQSLRRFELGALLVALDDPAPLQAGSEHMLLEQVRPHWLGRQQRRHPRTEVSNSCNLVIGLPAIHAQLLEQRPARCSMRIADSSAGGARLIGHPDLGAQLPVGQLLLILPASGSAILALVRWRHHNSEGLHLGLRYLKGLPRPVWLRRAPSAQTHPGILQSTPVQGSAWHHGLWLPHGQFVEGENLWLQLPGVNNQAIVPLPPVNLGSALVVRHPLRLA
jgi:hypothetical protein